MKRKSGWHGQPRKHSVAAKKGWSKRKCNLYGKKAIEFAKLRLKCSGKYVTKQLVISIAMSYLIAHGMPAPTAKGIVNTLLV